MWAKARNEFRAANSRRLPRLAAYHFGLKAMKAGVVYKNDAK